MNQHATTRRPIAHLIGSVPLPDAESVFRRLGHDLGAHLRRLPDGETGRRADWIGFVRRNLGRNPAFEKDDSVPPFQFKQWDGKVVMEWPLLKFKDGVDRASVSLETGYAADAIASYRTFDALRREGAIPEAIRFQVCAATPLAIAYMYITPRDQVDFTRAYTDHLISEIGRIAAEIPHERLALQWDVCQEVLMWEGYFEQKPGYKEEIIGSLAEIGNAVPDDIELGYHLCYGSPLDEHCIQPKDMTALVELAGALMPAMRRRVHYIHLPVPKERNDEAYFRPLEDLRLPDETELYIGCVHPDDPSGNAQKLACASAHVAIAGIGSECGWGRGDPSKLDSIIAAHEALIERT